MPRFTKMLFEGMKERGHEVDLWMPKAILFNLPFPLFLKKWMGYIDQYLIFPVQVKIQLRSCPNKTLFVFTDQALGPWVPLVAKRFHVIHCHDFLAQRSALGEIPENATGLTGRIYQAYIRRGYSKGRNFISVSQKSKRDLERFLVKAPGLSEVVLNGMNQDFVPMNRCKARKSLGEVTGLDLTDGFILHVGGNQWYKNRVGVIELYNAWCSSYNLEMPLLLVGEGPDETLLRLHAQSPFKASIHFFANLSDNSVRLVYAAASVLVYPSLAEGFGWPIAEAMASGCLVITTNEAPMTEVADNAGFLIPRRPHEIDKAKLWAQQSAKVINDVLQLSPQDCHTSIERGIQNAKKFDRNVALNQIEAIYQKVILKDKR